MSFLGDLLGARRDEPIDEAAKDELRLYADNTFALHGQHTSIIDNLKKKIAGGRYDANLAPRLWEYWVEAAAKMYCKEFCSAGQPWHSMFPTALRRALAQEIAKDEYERIVNGEYESTFKPKMSGSCGSSRGRVAGGRTMTKSEVEREFREYVLPGVKSQYERDGLPDHPARAEAWNDFVDGLQKEGRVSRKQSETWTNPY